MVAIVLSFNLYAKSEYAVTTTNLNLRESPTIKSNTITVLNSGDTVQIFHDENGWANVRFKELNGYVSNSFISKIEFSGVEKSIDSKNNFKDQKGFVAGFKFVFWRFLFLIVVVFGALITYSLRKSDGRFKKGYREVKMSDLMWIKLVLYSAVVSVLAGFIGGIISIFH